MKIKISKSELLYEKIKITLLAGLYPPGVRIDPAMLADEFNTSPTPVRFALYRLVGEGLIEDCAREGFHTPRITEISLRQLYDWMECLLLLACEAQHGQHPTQSNTTKFHDMSDDIVSLTSYVFDTIALGTQNPCLYAAIRHTNDKLSPIRRMGIGLLEHTTEELQMMLEHWQQRDKKTLKSAVIKYHERRREIVPIIVATANQLPFPFKNSSSY